jgi:hypothetical protein
MVLRIHHHLHWQGRRGREVYDGLRLVDSAKGRVPQRSCLGEGTFLLIWL